MDTIKNYLKNPLLKTCSYDFKDAFFENIYEVICQLRSQESAEKFRSYLNQAKNKLPDVVPTNRRIGFEIEVEKIDTGWSDFVMSSVWRWDSDGSLKENGVEFISNPLRHHQIKSALCYLWALMFTQNKQKPEFGWRSSFQFHIDWSDRSFQDVTKLVLVYLVFEELLFSFSGADRKQSIFCTPVGETALVDAIQHTIGQDFSGYPIGTMWTKYSALNLCPLFKQGTIEFRHMQGTEDLNKIINWLNLALCLEKYAHEVDWKYLQETILDLNTSSLYEKFKDEVFGPFAKFLANGNSPMYMSHGVRIAKECLNPSKSINVKHPKTMTPMAEFFKNYEKGLKKTSTEFPKYKDWIVAHHPHEDFDAALKPAKVAHQKILLDVEVNDFPHPQIPDHVEQAFQNQVLKVKQQQKGNQE